MAYFQTNELFMLPKHRALFGCCLLKLKHWIDINPSRPTYENYVLWVEKAIHHSFQTPFSHAMIYKEFGGSGTADVTNE